MASPAKKSRKQNFSASEISVLTERYEENMVILQSKFTTNITNAKKKQIWEDIAAAVNAVGVTQRTTQEVKDKWKNLQSIAKKEFSGFKNEQKKTGRGPAPKIPSQATLKIIDMFGDTPSFTGLQGFETDSVAAETPVEATANEVESQSVPVDVDENCEEAEEEAAEVDENAIVPVSKKEPVRLKRKSRKITQEQVLEEQYKTLLLKQENMRLMRRKLELEIAVMEQKEKGDASGFLATINLSPIVAGRSFLS